MLIATDNANVFNGGEADMICILKLPGGRYHVAFYEENPMPGPVQPIRELSFVRLKSKMHHTAGAENLEEAQEHARQLREKIILPNSNVFITEAIELEDPVSVWAVPNWTTGTCTLEAALKAA